MIYILFLSVKCFFLTSWSGLIRNMCIIKFKLLTSFCSFPSFFKGQKEYHWHLYPDWWRHQEYRRGCESPPSNAGSNKEHVWGEKSNCFHHCSSSRPTSERHTQHNWGCPSRQGHKVCHPWRPIKALHVCRGEKLPLRCLRLRPQV